MLVESRAPSRRAAVVAGTYLVITAFAIFGTPGGQCCTIPIYGILLTLPLSAISVVGPTLFGVWDLELYAFVNAGLLYLLLKKRHRHR